MTLHKLSAGSGYEYLTRQVAALDSTEKGRTALADCYSAKGESPGRWVGTGLVGIDGLEADDVVTADQMKHLFGTGSHPVTGAPLGAAHRSVRRTRSTTSPESTGSMPRSTGASTTWFRHRLRRAQPPDGRRTTYSRGCGSEVARERFVESTTASRPTLGNSRTRCAAAPGHGRPRSRAST
ncbi:MAG: relaxase domain-containing protein [Mycobacteriaceae bacterium]